jgi:hypothetical protein
MKYYLINGANSRRDGYFDILIEQILCMLLKELAKYMYFGKWYNFLNNMFCNNNSNIIPWIFIKLIIKKIDVDKPF